MFLSSFATPDPFPGLTIVGPYNPVPCNPLLLLSSLLVSLYCLHVPFCPRLDNCCSPNHLCEVHGKTVNPVRCWSQLSLWSLTRLLTGPGLAYSNSRLCIRQLDRNQICSYEAFCYSERCSGESEASRLTKETQPRGRIHMTSQYRDLRSLSCRASWCATDHTLIYAYGLQSSEAVKAAGNAVTFSWILILIRKLWQCHNGGKQHSSKKY